MRIRRTLAALGASSVLLVMAACGNGDGAETSDDDGANGADDGAEASEEPADEPEAGGDDDFTTDLVFGTGGTGGVYYPLGGEYSTIFEENIDGVTVNYTDSGASVENIGKIFQGDWQLGIAQSDTANAAATGDDDFEGAKVDNIGWIAALYPEAAHMVTLSDTGIDGIGDLEGARIAVGDVGSGTRAASDAILSAYGIEEGDYDAFEEDFASSLDLLRDGNIDASIFVVGTPTGSLGDLAATNDVELISLDADEAQQIADDTLYDVYTIDSDAYDFVEEDVTTLSVAAAILASTTQVSEDLGYEITAAIFDHTDEITLPQGDLISHDYALFGLGDVPLHPGAERYYEEQGLL